eukprot:CAMPEP_0113652768 /NCGR_PEP_ID=MMETSP0017_2-20120614/28200_1 /TAXON_ID=2856 /ORGANISM="Cylindrotheca closterium" /LENGTH=171 /DNA_ID=CAMNT_0000565673 /DNA_START=283 /DNA_END=794 /DNA_ORIENTATION=+ /assembly_acc=CAM_ASM_000147
MILTSLLSRRSLLLFLTGSLAYNAQQVKSQPILNTIRQYDTAKSQAIEATRIQSITVADGVPYVHLAMLIALSEIPDDKRQAVKFGGYQAMTAALLAIEHLNTGNGTLVEEVAGLDKRCNIKFTAEVRDTALSEIEALNHIVDLTSRLEKTELPAAVLGAFRSAVSIATSL